MACKAGSVIKVALHYADNTGTKAIIEKYETTILIDAATAPGKAFHEVPRIVQIWKLWVRQAKIAYVLKQSLSC